MLLGVLLLVGNSSQQQGRKKPLKKGAVQHGWVIMRGQDAKKLVPTFVFHGQAHGYLSGDFFFLRISSCEGCRC